MIWGGEGWDFAFVVVELRYFIGCSERAALAQNMLDLVIPTPITPIQTICQLKFHSVMHILELDIQKSLDF